MKIVIIIFFYIVKCTLAFIISRGVNSCSRHATGLGWRHEDENGILGSIKGQHLPKLRLFHVSDSENVRTKSLEGDLLMNNLETIALSGVYSIRILKLLLYVRYLIEWLPQVNPYLPPFDIIYQTTNLYLKTLQNLIPPIAGVDVSSIIAWFILENIESYLVEKFNLPI